MADDEDTLRRIFEEQLPACIRAGDAGGYIRLWGGPDPMWCPQDVADVRGLDAIHAAVTVLFADFEITGVFTADEVAAIGSRGYVRGTSEEQLRAKSGDTVSTLWTREVWLFVHEGDEWKVNCMIFNHKPGP